MVTGDLSGVAALRWFYQHFGSALDGCPASTYQLAMAIAERTLERGTPEVECSCTAMAPVIGHSVGCVSKARRRLIDRGILEHVGGVRYRLTSRAA